MIKDSLAWQQSEEAEAAASAAETRPGLSCSRFCGLPYVLDDEPQIPKTAALDRSAVPPFELDRVFPESRHRDQAELLQS